MYTVFTKLNDAQTYQREALTAWLEAHNDNAYRSQTSKWGEVIQRETDGAFLVIVCDLLDNSNYTIEEYTAPQEEI